MAEWYYGDQGKIIGPISFEDVVDRIRIDRNEVHLVWTEGMSEWTDAKDLPGFTDAFRSVPPPLPPQRQVVQVSKFEPQLHTPRSVSFDHEEPRDEPQPDPVSISTHPWRRYFARMLDLYVFVLCSSFAVGLLFPGLYSGSSKTQTGEDQALNLLYIAAYVPFEGFCLYAFGTTLGKAIYGIRLDPQGGEIALSVALRRSVLVWWNGLGIGIPIISLFTLISAFQNLKKNGVTTWDAKLGWSVKHSEFGVARWIGILCCWAGVTFIVAVGLSLRTA